MFTFASGAIAQYAKYLAKRLSDALRGLADPAVSILPHTALGRHLAFQRGNLLLQIQYRRMLLRLDSFGLLQTCFEIVQLIVQETVLGVVPVMGEIVWLF